MILGAGMLEYESLRLADWSSAHFAPVDAGETPVAAKCVIADAQTGAELGYAVTRNDAALPIWGWFAPSRVKLRVHEVEDDSLLFLMQGRARRRFWHAAR